MEDPNRRFWDPRAETMPRDRLRELQNASLRKQVARVYGDSPYYRGKFDAAGIKPFHIQTVADLVRVPFTTKQDYEASEAATPPYGEMLCVPEERITRYWTTSGSTGKPRVFGTTTKDYLDYLQSAARILWMAGVRPGTKVMVPFAHGHWIGLWGTYDAAWYLVGALPVPVGGFDTKARVLKMKELHIQFLVCTPTYATYMSEVCRELGMRADEVKLEAILIAGEPAPPATRRILEQTWGTRTVEFFGTTENLSYHGVECPEQNGMHFWEDRIITEVIDPETGEPVPDGEEGEMVFTNLTVEAMPAIRFRTGDIIRLTRTPCPCGSTHNKVIIVGRREQVLKVRGLNVYPRVIEEIVRSTSGLGSEYLVIFEREKGLDRMRLQLEPLPGVDVITREHIVHEIQGQVKMNIGITVLIELLDHGTLPVSEQKAKHIVDLRFEGR